MVKGDYTIKADRMLQTLLVADPEEATHVAAAIGAKPAIPDPPGTVAYQVTIDADRHTTLAKKHDL